MPGFGPSPWGGGAWGAGASPLGIAKLYSVGERQLRVELTASPRLDAAGGGIYDPNGWIVTRQDTGLRFHVMCVRYVSLPLVFDLVTLRRFGSDNVALLVANSQLHDMMGLQTPVSGVCYGTRWTDATSAEDGAVNRRLVARDLANRQVPGDTWRGGTLQIDPGGDYTTVSGIELVEKLIRRRVMTPRGAFRHLPDYGFGMQEKELFKTSELPYLRAEILRQVKQEPEVDDASATLSMDLAHGVLTLDLKVKLQKTGALVGITGLVVGHLT